MPSETTNRISRGGGGGGLHPHFSRPNFCTPLKLTRYETVVTMYYLKHAYRSALSDIKCEAQAKRFISDKARLQVL